MCTITNNLKLTLLSSSFSVLFANIASSTFSLNVGFSLIFLPILLLTHLGDLSHSNLSHSGIKIAGRNINNLRYVGDTTLMAESEEELKSLLKVKEENEKVDLKLNIQKTKIMASGPIISRQIDGKQWKQCQTLFLGAPKSLQMVIAAMKLKDAYSLEEKL